MKTKDGGTPAKLEKPKGLKAVNKGNSGTVEVAVEEAPGAGSFVFQFTLDPITDKACGKAKAV